jgi:hypothetical protein
MQKQLGKIEPYYPEKCPVIRTLDILGGKWRLAIIWELSCHESMSYNELNRHLYGITNANLIPSGFGAAWSGDYERILPNTSPRGIFHYGKLQIPSSCPLSMTVIKCKKTAVKFCSFMAAAK